MYSTYTTELDALTNGGGSLDPMGLYAIADRLATIMVPGVRERMSNLRYLTAAAVGADLCREINPQLGWQSGTQPYMAFEWHVVQGWIFQFQKDQEAIAGMPGIQKAQECFDRGLPLNASRYLKTAAVFGFHGVYRTLAQNLDIVDDQNRLMGVGAELAEVIQLEYAKHYPDRKWNDHRQLLVRAMGETLEKGEASRKWHWEIHGRMAQLLRPHAITRAEQNILSQALLSEEHPHRLALLDFLRMNGAEAWVSTSNERLVYTELESQADAETAALIRAILNYEHLSRLLHDAFHSLLAVLEQGGRVKTSALVSLPAVQRAWRSVPAALHQALNACHEAGVEPERQRLEKGFREFTKGFDTVEAFVNELHRHHLDIQRSKGRNGKQPWVRVSDDGHWVADIRGRAEAFEIDGLDFVHQYRCTPLFNFLKTLGHVAG